MSNSFAPVVDEEYNNDDDDDGWVLSEASDIALRRRRNSQNSNQAAAAAAAATTTTTTLKPIPDINEGAEDDAGEPPLKLSVQNEGKHDNLTKQRDDIGSSIAKEDDEMDSDGWSLI